MVKSRAGEAGEGVNDSHYVGIGDWSLVVGHWRLVVGHWRLVVGHWRLVIGHFVHNNEGVDGVMVHRFTGFHYFCIFTDCFRVGGHDLRNGCCEEILSEALHSPTDIAVCNDANEGIIFEHYSYS